MTRSHRIACLSTTHTRPRGLVAHDVRAPRWCAASAQRSAVVEAAVAHRRMTPARCLNHRRRAAPDVIGEELGNRSTDEGIRGNYGYRPATKTAKLGERRRAERGSGGVAWMTSAPGREPVGSSRSRFSLGEAHHRSNRSPLSGVPVGDADCLLWAVGEQLSIPRSRACAIAHGSDGGSCTQSGARLPGAMQSAEARLHLSAERLPEAQGARLASRPTATVRGREGGAPAAGSSRFQPHREGP